MAMFTKRMITTTIGLSLLAMTTGACATLGGAAIGAAAGTIYGAVKH